MADDTIFALSSGSGLAGVAVIRISGPQAGSALQTLTGHDLPPARMAKLARIIEPSSGDLLDQGLVLWFPGPASFTGEDCAEIQGHGGRGAVDGIMGALSSVPGLRPAEPGEFTRRAVLNGKLDLTQAEGIYDLIHSETEAQRRQAVRQTEGALGHQIENWRDRLIRLLAHGEAEMDFPDEGDAPDKVFESMAGGLGELIKEIEAQLADGRRGERLRDGYLVTLLGVPNAGKSTLLNALARRDVAITSQEPGTTRDVLEVALDLKGHPVRIADTAGLRVSDQVIEREGMRRAIKSAAGADLRMIVLDGESTDPLETLALDHWRQGDLVVLNKTDLLSGSRSQEILAAISRRLEPANARGAESVLSISALDDGGMGDLVDGLSRRIADADGSLAGSLITRTRHRKALEICVDHLKRAVDQMQQNQMVPELVAEDLRLALRELGRITGRVDVEDLLDVVFRDFCIGK